MQVRLHGLLAALLALVLGYAGCTAAAQVFEVAAGGSTAYGAEGASLVIHGDKVQTTLGAGIVAGHFAAGGNATRPIPGGALTLGQQLLRMDVPTDVFDTTHVFYGTGAGIRLRKEPGAALDAFAGVSSQEGGTPLFSTTVLKDPAVYAQWVHPLSYRCTIVSTALLSTQRSALESIECGRHGSVVYAATVGVGGGAPYLAASVVITRTRLNVHAAYIYAGKTFQRGNDLIQPTPEPIRENIVADYKLTNRFNLTAMHQRFLVLPTLESGVLATFDSGQIQPVLVPTRTNLNTAGIQYHYLSWGSGATFIHSSSQVDGSVQGTGEYSGMNSAYTAFLRKNFAHWDLTETLLHSFGYAGSANTILVNGLGVNLNPHLRLTENINVTRNGTSLSHGGVFLTTYSSFEVDYQTFYVATDPGNPFQQAMTFDARVRLPRNFALHAGSNIGPTGLTQYTFELASSFARDAIIADSVSQGGLGVNTLRGRVVEPNGQPVEGAAVMVGTERLYSDADGIFFFREKHPHKYPFKVLPNEFVSPWTYVTRSAPVEVQTSPGTLMLVVVVARTDQPLVQAVVVKPAEDPAFGPYRPYHPAAKAAVASELATSAQAMRAPKRVVPVPVATEAASVATEFGPYRPYKPASSPLGVQGLRPETGGSAMKNFLRSRCLLWLTFALLTGAATASGQVIRTLPKGIARPQAGMTLAGAASVHREPGEHHIQSAGARRGQYRDKRHRVDHQSLRAQPGVERVTLRLLLLHHGTHKR